MTITARLRSVLYWNLLFTVAAQQSSAATLISSSGTVVAASASVTSLSVPAQTHTVTVGKGNHKFEPDTILAKVGDIIQFQFFPPNHSVVRAEYGFPCIPYELTGVDKVGFHSGFHPVDAFLPNPPIFNLTVNDTQPAFFYCAAPGSCINYGMVGVINPNSTVSLQQQRNEAEQSTYMLAPGEPLPDNELPPSSASPSGTLNSASSTTSSTATSTPTASAPVPVVTTVVHGKHLAAGAIAGIAVGGVAAIVVLGALLFLLGRNTALLQKMKKDNRASQSSRPPQNQGYAAPYSPNLSGYASPHHSMGEYKPYGSVSPYQQPTQLAAVHELSSPPEHDQQKNFTIFPEEAQYDENRRQTITPPPSHRQSEMENLQHTKSATWSANKVREER